MLFLHSATLSALSIALIAAGSPTYGNPTSTLPSSLPASSSYNYLVPALYLNLTVQSVINLGNISTGSTQWLGHIVGGHLYSEPGFEPQFSGSIQYAEDYLTVDPDGVVARPDCSMTVVPDNGDNPFFMRITGVQFANAALDAITGSNNTAGKAIPYGYVYSVWTPFFYGGSEAYKVLQDSVFVGSETVSGSDTPGQFIVGMKFSKGENVNTTIIIGQEYP